MSSMRNAVQRRNHKERAQPKQREKWGLLEKHKDYSLRAKDFNEKKRRLKILRQKAAERNPDEFHFAMMSSKTGAKGIKISSRGNQVLSPEAVVLLKTQDVGYLRTMGQKTRKAIERLEQTLTLKKDIQGDIVLGSRQHDEDYDGPNHVSFVESVEEQATWTAEKVTLSSALADRLQDSPLGAELGTGMPDEEDEHVPKTKKQSAKQVAEQERIAKITKRRRRRDQEVRQSTLDILRKREKDLRAAETELESQRSKMSGGHGIGVTKTGVTFKNRVRKR